jgi:hypothetical protein
VKAALTRFGAAVLTAPAAALLASVGAGAIPSNKPFTVANYPVEARAQNAVAAKEKAHAEGQQAALRSLLKRIVPVTAYGRMERLRTVRAGDLIDGVAVRSERNSSTEYIASLDFAFQADEVRNLLRREGVPFIDEQAPKVTLVPILREAVAPPGAGGDDAAALSEFRPASGPWSQAWSGLDLDNTVTPVAIEALSATVAPETIASLITGQGGGEGALADAYHSETVLVSVAEVDEPGKRLHVTLAGRDAVGPVLWTRSYRLAGDAEYAMELAAVVSLGVLEGRWKAVKSEALGGVDLLAAPGKVVELEVEFASLSEWNDIRRQIVDMPGVDDVQIGAVSARSAEVSLRFPGGEQPLADAFARQGLLMRNDGGIWVVRARFQ